MLIHVSKFGLIGDLLPFSAPSGCKWYYTVSAVITMNTVVAMVFMTRLKSLCSHYSDF